MNEKKELQKQQLKWPFFSRRKPLPSFWGVAAPEALVLCEVRILGKKRHMAELQVWDKSWKKKEMVKMDSFKKNQLMINWWFGFLGSAYERDCHLGVPLESQTTNPNHQFTISWN